MLASVHANCVRKQTDTGLATASALRTVARSVVPCSRSLPKGLWWPPTLPRLPQAYARAAAALGFELGAAPHTQRDFSLGALPGGYRRLLHRPADLHFRLLQYGAPDQALAASDLELLRGTAPPPVAVLAPGAPRAVAHTYHNFLHRCMPSHTHCCCARWLCANARELSAAHGAYWAPGRADLQTTHHQLAHCFYVV